MTGDNVKPSQLKSGSKMKLFALSALSAIPFLVTVGFSHFRHQAAFRFVNQRIILSAAFIQPIIFENRNYLFNQTYHLKFKDGSAATLTKADMIDMRSVGFEKVIYYHLSKEMPGQSVDHIKASLNQLFCRDVGHLFLKPIASVDVEIEGLLSHRRPSTTVEVACFD